jgi:AAA15 family ATPase/GTPase
MLIEFSVGNYRSFKKTMTFSMIASNVISKDKALDENNVFSPDGKLKLLKCAAIYGANASGKSNLVQALRYMRQFVLSSSKDTQADEPIGVESFRLSTEVEDAPSFFEIVFLLDGTRFRYGFEADVGRIHSEWLFHVPATKEARLFLREKDKFTVASDYKEGRGLQERTRDNALFLSVVAQFNGELSQRILKWFQDLQVMSGLEDRGYREYTIREFEGNKLKDDILAFVKKMDLGIDNIEIESESDEVSASAKIYYGGGQFRTYFLTRKSVKTLHKKYGKKNDVISAEVFDIDKQESEGTKKIFALSGPLMDALQGGKTLVIDELDARFHPLITLSIIRLFNSNQTNPHNAQLVFTTHDTNLLNNKIFRRDQIWFTEKDKLGATDLYSLVEIKIRNDASFEKDYISGKYGAIPFVGNFDFLKSETDAE